MKEYSNLWAWVKSLRDSILNRRKEWHFSLVEIPKYLCLQLDGTTANTALYEIPVLDGFHFSQGTNTSEVTLNEAATQTGYSKRGRAMFTDSFAPAEWSFLLT